MDNQTLIGKDKILDIQIDHYNRSFDIHFSRESKRETLLVYVLLGCIVQYTYFQNPYLYETWISQSIGKYISVDKLSFANGYFGVIISMVTTLFVIRYYQLCFTIERSMSYLHQLELNINYVAERILIERESNHYYRFYPAFSKYVSIVYTRVIPFTILFISVLIICCFCLKYLCSDIVFIATLILIFEVINVLTVCLYWYALYKHKLF